MQRLPSPLHPWRRLLLLSAVLVGIIVGASATARAAAWQYYVPFETGKTTKSGEKELGKAFLWLPPEAKTIRGVLVGGQLGIELEVALDPEVRKACSENDLGIVYFVPHLSGVFHFWEDGNTDTQRWLTAFNDLAKRTDHPELRRVPWITMGHSTAGIFCRNVAYWQPTRVAGVLHIKSGNFLQKDHLPPTGSLAGIPLVAINGQFETFGPAEGIQPELGRETQWQYVRKNFDQMRQDGKNLLLSQWIDLGGDHFHGSPELSAYAALFIRKTARYRIPAALPDGNGPVACIPLKAEDGWLSDGNLAHSAHPPAPYADYNGEKLTADWHYDREIAEATVAHHHNMDRHQALAPPTCTWLDDGDGWTFKVHSEWLDTMPKPYGGSVGGTTVGHADTPIVYRAKVTEPVEQISADTFRLLRPPGGRNRSINLCAFNAGDAHFRATHRWGGLIFPSGSGRPQTIDFPQMPDMKPDTSPRAPGALASSGLPVHYEVDYGPLVVVKDKLTLSELPAGAKLPIECKVTAYQIGRRTGDPVAPAPPVSQVFQIR